MTAQTTEDAGLETSAGNMTAIVARHVAGTGFDHFDANAVARAKVRVLDSLGNIAAGHRAQGNDALLNLARTWGGAPEARVLVHGVHLPAHNAAMVNAVMMRSYDFEPIGAEYEDHTQTAAHISGTTVPVALAVAEQQNSSGRDLLTALITGDDLTARLAAASGFDVYGGQDNTGTVNGLGGTAVAAKLMGLTADQTRNALGLAVNQLSGTVANIFDQSLAFKLPMAFAARNSIVSAELARAGFTGPADPIGGRHGFFEMYCSEPAPEKATRRLGEVFYADCVIKPWASCRASHPSLDACVQLATRNSLNEDKIEEILIHVTPRTLNGFVGQPFVIGECPEVSGAFSIRFTAATALMYKTVRPEHLTLEHMQDPRLHRLLDKIRLVGSLPPAESLTAEVELRLRDGSVLRARTDVPRGDIYASPLSEAEILDKYYANAAFGGRIPRSNAEEAVELVQHLEQLDSLAPLINLLTPDFHQ
ncbi:MmgE/PrpD family protein [Pseudarthrobacter sulfonivorans]|uniref:MmgE/PrpD family protein n=1 Tax=Pseudarthrobacter sulfonivorans TaxID=121292 RepID=UPI00285E8BF5|nr:MmgE/PrpD family protein [Pseudarthrobacter sulfonivorans]MDR6415626.1 2-methylcitrate dehydratase PrpD [Pseudarthrobacter sulfonivorans]